VLLLSTSQQTIQQLLNFEMFMCVYNMADEVLNLHGDYVPLHCDYLLFLVLIVIHLCGLG
jgi:hypothetical protein